MALIRRNPTRTIPIVVSPFQTAIPLLVVLVMVFSLLSPHFFTLKTFGAIANQIPSLLVIAVGMTFVILLGGVDLSVGSMMALCSVGLAISLERWGAPPTIAVLFAVLIGLCGGAINGLIVARWRIPSFIVTLAVLEMARGAAYLVSDTRTIYIGSTLSWLSRPLFGFVSFGFLVAVMFVAVAHLVVQYSVFGRYVVGVGTNEDAMRLSGINASVIRIAVFALSGFTAATAAILEIGRLEAADPNAGVGLELRVIAAVVIGGTSFMGGRGNVVSTFVGVLIIAVLEMGLAQLGTSEPLKRIFTGAVIALAVIHDISRTRPQQSRVARSIVE